VGVFSEHSVLTVGVKGQQY